MKKLFFLCLLALISFHTKADITFRFLAGKDDGLVSYFSPQKITRE